MKRLLRLGLPLLAAAVAAFAVASAEGAKAPPPPGKGPKLTITPTTAVFGPVAPGVGASQEFVLGLKDGTSSGGLSVAVGGDEAFAISADTCTGTAISTSRTCSVTVTYTPTGYGESVEGTLTVTGKKDVKAASAVLVGSSTAAQLVSATEVINFGERQVGGAYPPLSIYFTNNATETLSLAGLDAPDGFNPTSSAWMTCDELAPGENCLGQIGFHPTAAGYYEGWFTTTWVNGANEPVATTSTHLTGTGTEPTAPPSLSINSPSWCANCAPHTFTFTVSMSRPSPTAVAFDWAASDDTAVGGTTCDGTADYTHNTMTDTGWIAAGSASTTIVFGLCENGPGYHYPWTPMKFTVTIFDSIGATISNDTGSGTITIS